VALCLSSTSEKKHIIKFDTIDMFDKKYCKWRKDIEKKRIEMKLSITMENNRALPACIRAAVKKRGHIPTACKNRYLNYKCLYLSH